MGSRHERAEGGFGDVPVLGAITGGRTYRNLALLLLLFPVGIANFVVLVTGISLGVSLTPILVGIPILAGVLVAATWLAIGYAHLLSALTDHEVHCEGFTFGPAGFWAGLKDVATRRRPYVLVVVFVLSFPLGIARFTVLVALFALSIALILAPVMAPLPVTRYRFGQDLVLDTPAELVAGSLVGIAMLVGSLWLVAVVGEALASAAAAVLRMDVADDGSRREKSGGDGAGATGQQEATQER